MNRQIDNSSDYTDISSSSTGMPAQTHSGAHAPASNNVVTETVKSASKDSVADTDGYVFTTGKVHKKKRVVHESYTGDDGSDLFLQSRTSNIAEHSHKHPHRRHHHHHHHKHKMKTWKKVLLSVGCTLLGLIVVAVGTYAYLVYRGSSELFNDDIKVSAPDGVSTQEGGKYVVYNGETYEFNENVTNVLFMGVDKRDITEDEGATVYGTGGQADVLVLASIDTSTGKISLVNISRETMIDVAVYSAGGSYVGTENQQICLSYAYGDGKEKSCENTVNSVQRLFYNIPINTYFSLDLDGISVINDSVGGVDVVSPETVGEFVEGESYHLEGDQAESFVRSRNTEELNSNTLRMERQKAYIQSFAATVISQTKEDITTPVSLYNATADYSCTNLSISKITYFAQQAVSTSVNGIEILTVPGTVTAGEKYAEFNVNEEEFYEMFLNLYYKKIS